ncbi:hypothetical protein B1748_05145 [Paenibacillus sp. MY03]|jgi:hypothetical protein|uniref:S-layer homology domain-containing protein n=1 Tax=Paenibacillus sp. MY03 TaxID=302980 RepID=UPI000B3C1665|nr:S-layer homology domain-containing protein [Paenibacillus sp. MY03]OUS78147.1 hypothetical protein B1748_05145 [Paenibacillus sp. MY03]
MKLNKRFLLLLILALLLVTTAVPMKHSILAAGNWESQVYDANAPGLETNPMKGLMPFSWVSNNGNTSFPHSLEWFYVPLSDLMTNYNSFDWAAIDNQLNAIANRGNHAIFRVYLDYPKRPIGTPQFLIDGGLLMRSYTDHGNTTSKAPDWNDGNLISALENFIEALGARYDGDNRIAFVQVGLYGFWGEWHTSPYQPGENTNGDDWRMNSTNRDRLLTAYKDSFNETQVLLRDPLGTSDSTLKNYFGYFDDSFAYETLGPKTWHFWLKMQSNGLTSNWQTHSMGGEIRPAIQSTIWDEWPNTSGQDWTTSVQTTHASWMADNWVFENSLTSTQYNNAMRAHKMLGYEFYVSSIRMPNVSTNGTLTLELKIKNTGIAPFPYNWKAEVSVINSSNQLVVSPWGDIDDWNLKDIQPDGADYTRSLYKSDHGLQPGDYKMVMRFVNPLPNGKALKFANEKQDWNWEGWLTLGSFTVTDEVALDEESPTIPGQPTAVDIQQNRLQLTWSAATDNFAVSGYEVNVDGTIVSDSSLLDTEYSLNGLQPDKEYTITVRALDAAGNRSAYSAPLVVKTQADLDPDPVGALRLEAESFSSSTGRVRAFKNELTKGAGGNGLAGWTQNGDVIAFAQVDFGAGYNQVAARYATEYDGSSLEIRTGSADGTLIGTIAMQRTGGWAAPGSWKAERIDLSTPLKGVQDVYVIFKNTTESGVSDLDWVRFTNNPPDPGGSDGTGSFGGPVLPLLPAPVVKDAVIELQGRFEGMEANAVVPDPALKEAIEQAIAGKSKFVEVRLVDGAERSGVTIELPADAFATAKQEGLQEIRLSTGLAELVIPVTALDDTMLEQSDRISFRIALTDKAKWTAEARAVIGGGSAYELTAKAGERFISRTSGDQPIRISLPYALSTGQHASQVVVYRFNDDGKPAVVGSAKYESEKQFATLRTYQLGQYAVSNHAIGYIDLNRHAWAVEAIEAVAARGWMNGGAAANTFEPAQAVTRGELVAALMRTLDLEASKTSVNMGDVVSDSPYYREIATALQFGIARGIDGQRFGSELPMTRQDMAVLIHRALQVAKLPIKGSPNDAVDFKDAEKIRRYAAEAVQALAGAELLIGTGNGMFSPDQPVTRAQAAVLLMRISELHMNNSLSEVEVHKRGIE